MLALGAVAAASLVLTQPATRAQDSVRYEALDGGVRVAVEAPAGAAPSLLVVYAAPNGSTAEETVGRRPRTPAEWKYDIQHVLAQVRAYRATHPGRAVALAVLQSPQKSWPAWRAATAEAPARARDLLDGVRRRIAPDASVALLAHSGGGALIWSLLESGPMPGWIERMGFLDANYSFDHAVHAAPLLAWLDGHRERRLVIVAYDDRSVTLDGKPVVGPDGGTQRATSRMRAALDASRPLTKAPAGDCDRWTDAAGQVDVRVDRNFANTILHSALVGDMNGVLHALTFGETPSAATVFGRPRAYTTHIAPAEVGPVLALPARPPGAPRGSELADMLAPLPSDRREAAIADHALAGNVPDFLRQLRRVTYKARDAAGADHTVSVWFTPDVLSLGCDDDFVRVPMTPSTAQRVADAFGCLLPTPRISDEVWRAAESRLQPRPLTSAREAWTTFVSHNAIIQEQLRAVPNGPVIAGHKKDIVICRSLPESPGKVAIYGWHRDDGKPIQPVSMVHAARYVDYSHGVRLVWKKAEVDGREVDLPAALRDANLCYLFSDEGPLTVVGY